MTLWFEIYPVVGAMGGGIHELPHDFEPLWLVFLRAFGILFFVVLNGFFVAAEFSIVKVRATQLDSMIEAGSKRAKLAKRATEHLDAYLSATQLGITLASIALGFLAEPFAASLIAPLFYGFGVVNETLIRTTSFGVSFAVATFLHVVLGELLPKSLAIRKALATSMNIARPLAWFHWFFRPAIWVLNGAANKLLKWVFRTDPVTESELVHSADELRMLVHESGGADEVTPIERDILVNALALNDRMARDVMLPRSEVITLDVNADFELNFDKALESEHTRFPLVDGHLDKARGIVHVKDLLKLHRQEKPDLTTIERPLDPVPEMMPLDKLLKSFLDHKSHMALVVDEFGGSLGIVTLDNVLEELVGDIQDEFDNYDLEPDEFTRVNEDEFIVMGAFPLYELSEHTDLDLEDLEVSTVGGYVTSLFGHLPDVGEQIRLGDYLVTVTEANDRSIGQVQFRRQA